MSAELLATIFIVLMGIAVLVYAIADGYDLGVGMLLPPRDEPARDKMIASIGPFWDANETWLVLAVGLLLIAFPKAHSLVFYHLYLPATFMLIGLILRGVSFDFRAKTSVSQKKLWDRAFWFGSLLTSFCQGYMLGHYVVGFSQGWEGQLFSVLSGLGVSAAYCLMGAAWLVYKTEGDLQARAFKWLGLFNRITFLGVIAVSLANLWVNPKVFSRWFEMPLAMFVVVIPALCITCFAYLEFVIIRAKKCNNDLIPLLLVIAIFILSFCGLAFSFYPYIVPGSLTIWEAASAPESLRFLLWGTLIVVPTIGLYTAYSYWVFRGKATDLSYE